VLEINSVVETKFLVDTTRTCRC